MKSYLYDALWSIIALACLVGAVLVILGMVGCSTSGGTTNGNATVICLVCVNPLEGSAERLKDAKDDNEDDTPQPEPTG